jgi:uncharacterized membrane protein
MVDSIIAALEGLPKELVIFVISMLPILELRGGMVAASLLGVPWAKAFIICFIGNMLPIPFILLFIKQIFKLLKKIPKISNIIIKIENAADKKGGKINKSRNLGLFTFVAVPLPGTGAWTGALIATMLDIRMRRSFPIIFIGVITAGIIMSILTYFIPGLFF